MARSPAARLQTLPSSIVKSVKVEIGGTGEQRRSLTMQELSQFALTDSLRKSVGSSLRKRALKSDCAGDLESETPKAVKIERDEHSETKCEAKTRPTRVKRCSAKVASSEVEGRLVSSSGLHSISIAGQPRGNSEDYRRLAASFFQCDALELAPKLLKKLIRRDDVILQITEVEAYRPNDTACHARVGRTTRTEPLFGPAGHAYVYLCYGLHVMLNVVADRVDVGAAVLIRACSPIAGLRTIQDRRGQATEKPVLLTGPGKVGQALGLTTDWTNHPLYTTGGLEILDAPPAEKILVGPRVGIDYAQPKDVAALWRFAVADSLWGCTSGTESLNQNDPGFLTGAWRCWKGK